MKVRLDNADHRGKEFHSRVGKVTRAEKVTLNDRANSIETLPTANPKNLN
jgi:hypothetical protein